MFVSSYLFRIFGFLALLSVLLVPVQAFAWGSRGHALVTEVAVRLLGRDLGQRAEQVRPFSERVWMLAHLSNIPDNHWRSLPKGVTSLLNPTHFIDFEYLGVSKASEIRAMGIPDALYAATKNCLASGLGEKLDCESLSRGDKELSAARVLSETGSAPWRIAELSEDLSEDLKRVKGPSKSKGRQKMSQKSVDAVNEALVAAGILSHFVADLAQPHHSTADYDSFGVGQGGLHSYFETEVVDAMDLSLVAEVCEQAEGLTRNSFLPAKLISGESALDWSFLLAADSFSELATLTRLDKESALLKASVEREGLRIPAERRLAADPEVQKAFAPFVRARLARGAFVLAALYRQAWESAGKPDLSSYQSYFFEHRPEPEIPRYLQ